MALHCVLICHHEMTTARQDKLPHNGCLKLYIKSSMKSVQLFLFTYYTINEEKQQKIAFITSYISYCLYIEKTE